MNTPTPPVNESWKEKFLDAFCKEQGKQTGSNAYLDMGTKAKYIMAFIETILSTARQEERDRAKQVVIETMYKMDRVAGMGNIIKAIDSLTSKGGVS